MESENEIIEENEEEEYIECPYVIDDRILENSIGSLVKASHHVRKSVTNM